VKVFYKNQALPFNGRAFLLPGWYQLEEVESVNKPNPKKEKKK
jgi:hypothetical protein